MIEQITILIILVFTFFWMWMIADAATSSKISRKKRRAWLLFMGLTFLPGALIYYIFKKRRYTK
jgi:hypothetical protein